MLISHLLFSIYFFILLHVDLRHHSWTHLGVIHLHRPSPLRNLVAGRQVWGTSWVISQGSTGKHFEGQPNAEWKQTELGLIYSKTEFKACCGAVDLFKLSMDKNLGEVFSETVTLLKILITTLMTIAESERCFLTLKIENLSEKHLDPKRGWMAWSSHWKICLLWKWLMSSQQAIEKFCCSDGEESKIVQIDCVFTPPTALAPQPPTHSSWSEIS